MNGTPELPRHPFHPNSLDARLPRENHNEFNPIHQEVVGTLELDVDGTLTVPDKDYTIDEEVLDVLADFLAKGGSEVYNTGATLQRIERQVLTPIFRRIDEKYGRDAAVQVFTRGIVVQPENGSATCLCRGVHIEENELYFDWHKHAEEHVPNKAKLRRVLTDEFLPQYRDAYIVDDTSQERSHRDYILSIKKLKNTRELQAFIEKIIVPKHPEIDWKHISIKPARTTLDFVSSDSGKTHSTEWLISKTSGFSRPVVGFGDLGDEFGKCVLTFNVNRKKPNEYRSRGVPAIDANYQAVLRRSMYIMAGKGPDAKVFDKQTGKELQVVRYPDGQIVFVKKNPKNEYRKQVKRPCNGDPIVMLPLFLKIGDEWHEVGDAGQGTSVLIRWLWEEVGFFSPEESVEDTKSRGKRRG